MTDKKGTALKKPCYAKIAKMAGKGHFDVRYQDFGHLDQNENFAKTFITVFYLRKQIVRVNR